MNAKKFRIRLAGLREDGVITVDEHDIIMRLLTKNINKKELKCCLTKMGILNTLEEHIAD